MPPGVETMARAPFQVVVLPFRLTDSGGVEFAVLRRADDGQWQGVAGGLRMKDLGCRTAPDELRQTGDLADAK